MSKALEEFKMIKFKTINAGYNYGYECWNIVEKALERLEEIDNTKPNENLECLEEMYQKCIDKLYGEDLGYCYHKYNTIKQALTTKSKKELAWEIAVKKNVDLVVLKRVKTVTKYNEFIEISNYDRQELTEEEFNLLKEML